MRSSAANGVVLRRASARAAKAAVGRADPRYTLGSVHQFFQPDERIHHPDRESGRHGVPDFGGDQLLPSPERHVAVHHSGGLSDFEDLLWTGFRADWVDHVDHAGNGFAVAAADRAVHGSQADAVFAAHRRWIYAAGIADAGCCAVLFGDSCGSRFYRDGIVSLPSGVVTRGAWLRAGSMVWRSRCFKSAGMWEPRWGRCWRLTWCSRKGSAASPGLPFSLCWPFSF